MTVHAILVLSSDTQATNPDLVPEPAPPPFSDVISDRMEQHVLGTFAEALPEQAQPEGLVEADELSGAPAHVKGLRRFKDGEDKAALLDAIEREVVADAEWAALYSHTCDHDLPPDMRSGCDGWTAERAHGTVPDEVKP
jgi:hypothetical protein